MRHLPTQAAPRGDSNNDILEAGPSGAIVYHTAFALALCSISKYVILERLLSWGAFF